MAATAESAFGSVRVRVEVVVDQPAEARCFAGPGEWEVVLETAALLTAVRDRLARRLSSRQARATPKERIVAAWQAGVDSCECGAWLWVSVTATGW